MFNRNKSNDDTGFAGFESARAEAPSRRSERSGGQGTFSIIGADVHITGNIAATVDLHIDGKVDGDVTCASLVQGPESEINGCVRAEKARLAGTIEGSIEAGDLVIESSSRINGDVHYDNLSIEPGGQVDGQFRHRGTQSTVKAHQAKPDLKIAESAGASVEGGEAAA